MTIDWSEELPEQLDWHWQNQARPRLDGLADAEYRWEPVGGCWNVRPREQVEAELRHGQGDFVLEFAWPQPSPPPVTTIAWRMAHLIVGVFGQRSAAHFGGPPMTWDSHVYAGSAAEALAQIDDAYGRWVKGVRGLGAEGLERPCGPAEGAFAEYPIASLILHINREAIHHMAEIALLRDLYRNQG
jgi:DinB family protein